MPPRRVPRVRRRRTRKITGAAAHGFRKAVAIDLIGTLACEICVACYAPNQDRPCQAPHSGDVAAEARMSCARDLLAEKGVVVSRQTLQRAVQTYRQALKAEALATTRVRDVTGPTVCRSTSASVWLRLAARRSRHSCSWRRSGVQAAPPWEKRLGKPPRSRATCDRRHKRGAHGRIEQSDRTLRHA